MKFIHNNFDSLNWNLILNRWIIGVNIMNYSTQKSRFYIHYLFSQILVSIFLISNDVSRLFACLSCLVSLPTPIGFPFDDLQELIFNRKKLFSSLNNNACLYRQALYFGFKTFILFSEIMLFQIYCK